MAGGARYDATVIGGGHNALVTAAYLARAGLRTVVLERSEVLGGALATAELGGIRVPAVADTVGRFRPAVVRDLGLAGHGLHLLRPEVRAFAPRLDGPPLTLWTDPLRTVAEMKAWSPADAEAFVAFDRKVRALASFMAYLDVATPPDIRNPSMGDAMAGFRIARAFRRLSPQAGREVLRVLPMAVADFVAESFESDAVRGLIAARAVRYTAMGPWSAGTTTLLLGDSAGNEGGAAGQTVFARGGPGALAEALAGAAQSFGAELRTGAEVVRITDTDGRATGVALATGEVIRSDVVVSGADPKRTLLTLVDPVTIGPTLAWRAENLRLPGVVAKVNLTLSGVPRFVGADGDGDPRLRGRIVIAPGVDHLERAFDASKYGLVSDGPFLEATIPTLSDPTLAPDGIHAMSVLMQYAPYHRREGDWETERDGLGDLVLKTLEEHAPGLSSLVTARQVLTPVDLERRYGLTEGHPLHGEPGLDQFFAWRPLLGHARYRFAIPGLYLCGSGAHPGGGVTGAPGANAAREILADRKRRRG
jgi:phytoene dehydrogenase-like protein